MAPKHSEDFKREAVRIATHSGLARRQVASDLGVGLSNLWQVDAGLFKRTSCRRGRGTAPREWALAQRAPYSAGGEGSAKVEAFGK